MAVFKCKMCGGNIELVAGSTVIQCEYCDTYQTVPNADDEKKMALFTRANKLRFGCEFDKASAIYENIAAEFPDEPEAYWGLVLCKYGIEYVDDPATGKKVPTCHRSSFESVMEDESFEQALENADPISRSIYRDEAKQIEELRKKIIEVSSKEQPYDIFICYKETDYKGDRTIDSVRAQDIYDAFTLKGYRVFFSRITLEDKLGVEYEPYIFAALNSAKIMLVVGTDYEHFNAVWVKNEWSRFIKLMLSDKSKHLIPCYENIDAYDMPKEFARLQAQDMGKIGYIQDLVRGVEKLYPRTAKYALSAEVEEQLRKVQILLENKKWKSVMESCNAITDTDPECAMAYVYQLARVRRVTTIEALDTVETPLSESNYYEKALKYADPALEAQLKKWCEASEQNYNTAIERSKSLREKYKFADGLIASGKNHTVAVKTDGTVLSCGSNEFGQCNVGTWRDIVYVACGDNHTVGIKSDRTVVACGNNEKGQCNIQSWTDIVHISCDSYHTVGVKSDGTVVACGDSENGRLNVSEWKDAVSCACGYRHTVALCDEKVVAVGASGYDQCDVKKWTEIIAVSANNVQTVGLKKNGTVIACGDTSDNRISVKEWRNIISVACGISHTAGLTADGKVITCGNDGSERCSGTNNWENIIGVYCGAWSTFGLKADGTVVCTGDINNGKEINGWKLFDNAETIQEERTKGREERKQLDAIGKKKMTKAVERHNTVKSILSGGENHTVAVLPNMTAVSCGSDTDRQHARRNWGYISHVSCGANHTVAIAETASGQLVLSVGDNQNGQCEMPSKHTKRIKSVSCGYRHTVVLYEDGTVLAVGDNDCDQCETEEFHDIVEVACGIMHTVGLRSDGTVVSCGANGKGQRNVEGWADIVMIAACNHITVGLRSDGTVVACGENEDGQLGVNGWDNIVSVACGSHHTVGLKSDGTVVACGFDPDNRCAAVSKWKDIVGIACGTWITMGVKSDGTIVSCGENANGQRDIGGWKLFNNIDSITEERKKYAVSGNFDYSDDFRYKTGPSIITGISAIGTRSYDDMWPQGYSRNTFNYNEHNVIAFQITVPMHKLSSRRSVKLGTIITNANGKTILDEEITLAWASNYDKLSKTFIIHGKDGSVVPTGKYKAEFWVDESAVVEYNFTITSNDELRALRNEPVQKPSNALAWRRAGLCQHCGGSFKGLFSKVCSNCGRRKDY